MNRFYSTKPQVFKMSGYWYAVYKSHTIQCGTWDKAIGRALTMPPRPVKP